MAAAIPIILTLVGTGLKVYSQLEESKFKSEQQQYEAQQLEREKRRMLSKQKALYAKSGVMFTEGSPLEVMVDTATQYEMDIRMKRRSAAFTKRVGYIQAGSTLLTGFGSLAGSFPTKTTIPKSTGTEITTYTPGQIPVYGG